MKKIIKRIQSRAIRKYNHLIDKKALLSNKAFKNLYKDKRCFIIGNGPSVKDQDLTRLRDESTFVVNGFYIHDKYDQIHPKFYAVFDSKHFRGDKESIDFLENLNKNVHEDTIMIFPLKSKRLIETKNILPRNEKIYIYAKGFMKDDRLNTVDISKAVPSPMSVSAACLMVAMYMGFDPIYLVGLEHGWLARRPDELVDAPHFYNNDEKHYLSNDFSATYEYDCWCTYMLFKNYRILKKMTRAKIINLTPNSYLDVFPVQRYEDIINLK